MTTTTTLTTKIELLGSFGHIAYYKDNTYSKSGGKSDLISGKLSSPEECCHKCLEKYSSTKWISVKEVGVNVWNDCM